MTRLESILRSLSTPVLVNLYGAESVEAIAALMGDAVTSNRITKLLFNKYGAQILAVADIRRTVISKLTRRELAYLCRGDYVEDFQITEAEAAKLFSMNWGRTQTLAKRLVDVLGLDDSYLPPVVKKKPSSELIVPNVRLYPHQRRLKDQLVRTVDRKNSRLLVHMPTGAGKTRTSIEAVIELWKGRSDRRKNIMWIAHSEELCEQAFETFRFLWSVRGDCEVDINRVWGGHDLASSQHHEVGQIYVCGFQKLYSMIKSSRDEVFIQVSGLKQNASIIVVDEAHKVIAPTYKACIEYLFNDDETCLLGLTATPGRSTSDIFERGTSETTELARFFDGNKLGIVDENDSPISDPIGYLQDRQFLSRILRKKVTTNISLDLNDRERKFVSDFLELPQSVLNRLATNDERNALILSEIAALKLQNRAIIVFALSVEHSRLIAELLTLKNISARAIDGETPSHEREKAISQYKNGEVSVLVNYGVLTTGFDAPNTNAVVITRPTASIVLYSQMIGRGIRGPKVGGNKECSLVDLEDNLLGFPSESLAFNYFDDAWS